MAEPLFTIRVELSERGYDIIAGSGCLPQLGDFLRQRESLRRAIIITDARVESLYAGKVAKSLEAVGAKTDAIAVPAGEESKSVAQAEHLWNKLLELGADRATLVIALGGGVVGDLAGFVAATFARGLRLVQVPTTLLAQVDSAIGGKVGVNLHGAKNMVGAFWQPRMVLADTTTLQTLPEREYRSGLAEVVKYAVIMDADFFTMLETNISAVLSRDPTSLANVVAHCCQLKAEIVQSDEREVSGRRAILNYGHTVCHALETVTGYGQFLHGEAVSIGMMCEARLAQILGRVDDHFIKRQHDLLAALGLPVDMPRLDAGRLLATMQHDKKTENGRLRFVLPARMGHAEMVDAINAAEVQRAMQ